MLLDMNSSFPAMGKYWDCCPQGSVVLAARRLPGVIKGPDAQVAFSCVQPGRATGRMLHRDFPDRSACQRATLLFEETSKSRASMQAWFAARRCSIRAVLRSDCDRQC